jgi:tetratricopeptide (TPR) repeat protein
MTQKDNRTGQQAFTPPGLDELMARYLHRQTEKLSQGLVAAEPAGEVQPYEAGPVQPVDARLAWEEMLAVVHFFGLNVADSVAKAPPDWPTLVATHEPVFDLAFCVGNFPQLVRNLHPLLQARNLAELRSKAVIRPVFVPALLEWTSKAGAKKSFLQVVMAAGCLRLAGEYDRAAAALQDAEKLLPSNGQTFLANEKASLAWHRGDSAEARQLWLTQPESVPVLFNRGMSALFLNEPEAAQANLTRAVAQLPERSAWHHLAQLYLALSKMSGR